MAIIGRPRTAEWEELPANTQVSLRDAALVLKISTTQLRQRLCRHEFLPGNIIPIRDASIRRRYIGIIRIARPE